MQFCEFNRKWQKAAALLTNVSSNFYGICTHVQHSGGFRNFSRDVISSKQEVDRGEIDQGRQT